jgi:hypothetical protein
VEHSWAETLISFICVWQMVISNTSKNKSILVSLTDEELDRIPPISEEAIKNALEVGRRERVTSESSARPLYNHSRILFR